MINNIVRKLKKKQELTEEELNMVLAVLPEYVSCIDYYSQNFVGTWDSDKVNVNWRAKKCNDYITNLIKGVDNAG